MTDIEYCEIQVKICKNDDIKYFKIDKEDYEKVYAFKWTLDTNGYVLNNKCGRIHRYIMKCKNNDGQIVDHINNDRLDNRKTNLRMVNYSQNGQNKLKRKNTSSKFIGVSLIKDTRRWSSRINTGEVSKTYNFEKEDHAAYWYDQLALKYYGMNSKINGIDKPLDFIEPIKKSRELPKNISSVGKKYRVVISRKFIGSYETLEEAINILAIEKEKLIQIQPKLETIIEKNKDGTAIIKTKKDQEFLVSDEDYFDLKQYTWCTDNDGYAISRINKKLTPMHIYLMNPVNGVIVDHINHNVNDNRRINLRISNRVNNSHNRTKQVNSSSQYIGVCFYKSRNKYVANINHNKKTYFLGYYLTELAAAQRYNEKATELYGEFANLNIL